MFRVLSVVAVVALIAVLWQEKRTALEFEHVPFEPLNEQHHSVKLDGGARTLEYFVRNPQGLQTVLVIHGQGQTGQFYDELPDTADVLTKQDIRLVSLSMPGFGLSTPLELADKGETLRRISESAISLMNQLNVERFYVIGVSTGATPALKVASLAGERCLGVSSLVGVVWSHLDHAGTKGARGADLAMKGMMFISQFDLLYYPLVNRVVRRLLSVGRFLAADTALLLRHSAGAAMLARFQSDLDRSVRYYIHGVMYAIQWLNRPHPRELLDWSSLTGVPVLVASAEQDLTVPASNEQLLRARLPHARFRSFPGGHLHLGLQFFPTLEALVNTAAVTKGSVPGKGQVGRLAERAVAALEKFEQILVPMASGTMTEEDFVVRSKEMALGVKDVMEELTQRNRALMEEIRDAMIATLMKVKDLRGAEPAMVDEVRGMTHQLIELVRRAA